MVHDRDEGKFNWGVGLGLGAVVGVLVSAIVGMLRLSKPKDEEQIQSANSPQTALTEDLSVNASAAGGSVLETHAAGKAEVSSVQPASAAASAGGS